MAKLTDIQEEYLKDYEYFRKCVNEKKFEQALNRHLVIVAVDSMKIDALAFVSKYAWNLVSREPAFALSIPKYKHAYVTWSGKRSMNFMITVIHEILEILSARETSEPSVRNCNHSNCIMNPAIDGVGKKLHPVHVKALDNNKDGFITIEDLDTNRDNLLSVGVVKMPTSPRILSKKVVLNLGNEFCSLFPKLEKRRVLFKLLSLDDVVKAAGTSWGFID